MFSLSGFFAPAGGCCALALALSLLAAPARAEDPVLEQAVCFGEAMEKLLVKQVLVPAPPVDAGNGAFILHDVQVYFDPARSVVGTILSLDVYEFDCAGFRKSGFPQTLRLRASGIVVPPAHHPLAEALPGLPLDGYIDLDLDLSYDIEKQRLTLRRGDFAFAGIGNLFVAVDATGPDLVANSLSLVGLQAIALGAAFGTIHDVAITLQNHAGNRFLEAIAKHEGTTMVVLRDRWLSHLDEMMNTEGKEAVVPLLQQLKLFVADMRSLTVRMRPPGGSVTVKELAAVANDMGMQAHMAGLTIEANR